MPAPPHWKAVFRVPVEDEDEDDAQLGDEVGEDEDDEVGDGTTTLILDVLAFDAAGHACVMSPNEGKLRRANSYTSFAHLYTPTDVQRFVAYLPGQGWKFAHGETAEDMQVRDVVAWAITDLGDALPIYAQPEGYQWAAWPADPEYSERYAHMRFIAPTVLPTPSPNGRSGGRSAASPIGRKGAAQVGETVGDEGTAHPSPNGRSGASPKPSPNGRSKKSPTRTPTIDDLTTVQRERLAQLGEQYPGEVPNRDAVIAHMRAQGIAGFSSKEQTDVLIKVLRQTREQYQALTG